MDEMSLSRGRIMFYVFIFSKPSKELFQGSTREIMDKIIQNFFKYN